MTEKKPVGLMVFGIVNIIVGTLMLFCSMCFLAAQVSAPYLQDVQGQQAKGIEEPKGLQLDKKEIQPAKRPQSFDTQEFSKKLQERLDSDLPMYATIKIAQQAISIVLFVLLILAGIALLRARPIARMLCMAYSLSAIVLYLIATGYYFLCEKPVTDAVLAQEMPADTPPFVLALFGIGGVIATILIAFFFIAHSALLLLYVSLSSTRKRDQPLDNR